MAETVSETTAASSGFGDLMQSTLTFSERITLGLEVLLFGMAVVFAVLILIWAILTLFKIIFYDIPNKKSAEAKPVASETVPEPPAPAPVPEPVVEAVSEPALDDAEIAAAIAAAIAVVLDKPQTSFRVVSFRRTASK